MLRAHRARRERGEAQRLVAITGVGTGETHGHGGLLHDWIVYPLLTRHRYADKTAPERLIEASGLEGNRSPGSLRRTQVRGIAPDLHQDRARHGPAERDPKGGGAVRVDQFTGDLYVRRKPFISYP